MLVCDLDGTLVGDRDSTHQLLAWLAPKRQDIALVFNTGRSALSTHQLIEEAALPWPDALVTGLGTAISFHEQADGAAGSSPDPEWHGFVSQEWSSALVEEITGRFAPELVAQEEIAQTDLKKSFTLLHERVLPPLKEALIENRMAARFVQTESLLDVIPARAGKQSAVLHLQRRFGTAPADVVVCGDSENDLDMLLGASKAIVVGNATRGLLAALGGNAFRARADAAAGILEGLIHLGW